MSFADRLKRGAASVAAKVPVGRGPQAVQAAAARAHLLEARRVLRGAHDPRGALALAEPLVAVHGVEVEAWTLVAEAHAALGRGRDALGAARHATEHTSAGESLDALLAHLRIAERQGEPDEAAGLRRRLVEATGPADADRVVEALRDADETTVDALQDRLQSLGASGWERSVDALRAELAIVRAPEDGLAAAVAAASDRLEDPVPVLAKALTRRRDWPTLVEVVGRTSVTDADRASSGLEIRRAASAALKAGQVGAAAALARRALDLTPDDRWARETRANAEDQLEVVHSSWRPAATGPTGPAHQPRTGAVLSVLAQSLPIRTGGYATRSHGILTGLRERGWDIEAVTRLGFPYDSWPAGDDRVVAATETVDGLRYHRVLESGRRAYPQYPLTDYVGRYADALEAHARRHGAALLHASSFHVNGLAAREVATRLGIPYVYEMRGLEDLLKVSRDPGFAGSERDRFLSEVELAACAGAERVLVITEALRREMVDRGVPEDKLVVLPNGVHASRFTPRARDTELEASLGLGGRTVIGYAGSVVDYEGLDLLLEAVALLRPVRDDFRVVIVGDGAHADEIRRISTRLGLDDLVTFTGRVPHEEVPRYLSLFDVVPFPRLPLPVCEMISPIKPFESMASGLAPVVSSVAALTEIVEHDHTGLVFDKGSAASLADALARLLDDPDLRARLGASARDWVRRERDWSAIVGIADGVYREILG